MKFEVTILGSSSATPIYNRNPTSQVLNINERLYLVDCGEGTQQQMLRFDVRGSRIDHIFISHLHGDHYLGLIGLLSSLHLNGRKKALKLFGPSQLKEIIDLQFKYSETTLQYELDFFATDSTQSQVIVINDDVTIETIPLDHRIPCNGFLFREKKRLRKLLKDELERIGVPIELYTSLKKGADYTDPKGKLYKNDTLTTDSDKPKTYAYCSDTLFNPQYFKQMLDRANETHHTTALQAAEIAVTVNAKRLLIGHFSARYKSLDDLLEEAQSVFPNTALAIEGKTFVV
jgi:ribonuclease Z